MKSVKTSPRGPGVPADDCTDRFLDRLLSAPSVVFHFRYIGRADGFRHCYALAVQDPNLSELGNDLSGFVVFTCHLEAPCFLYIRVDRFNGEGQRR